MRLLRVVVAVFVVTALAWSSPADARKRRPRTITTRCVNVTGQMNVAIHNPTSTTATVNQSAIDSMGIVTTLPPLTIAPLRTQGVTFPGVSVAVFQSKTRLKFAASGGTLAFAVPCS